MPDYIGFNNKMYFEVYVNSEDSKAITYSLSKNNFEIDSIKAPTYEKLKLNFPVSTILKTKRLKKNWYQDLRLGFSYADNNVIRSNINGSFDFFYLKKADPYPFWCLRPTPPYFLKRAYDDFDVIILGQTNVLWVLYKKGNKIMSQTTF